MASNPTKENPTRFSAPISLPVEMALAALPLGRHLTAKTDARRIMLRAMEEGVCALARHYEETAEWPGEIGSFHFSVSIRQQPGNIKEFVQRARALETMLAGIGEGGRAGEATA